ncbi:MAG TPA: hypothetical protein VN229_20080 [Terriglobales bacterium]|nr:hypothetical protein [Terriglobales bacterium]
MQFLSKFSAALICAAILFPALSRADDARWNVHIEHLLPQNCHAGDLAQLVERQKLDEPAPERLTVGRWEIVRWPNTYNPKAINGVDTDKFDNRDFIEIYPAGANSIGGCRFLVTNDPESVARTEISWRRDPIADRPTPQLIIGVYSGGATGCCWTSYIVSLGAKLRVDSMSPIVGENGISYLEKNPKSPPDITLPDMGFPGIGCCSAENHGGWLPYSGAPNLIFAWRAIGYELAPPRHTPPPSASELTEWRQQMKDAFSIMTFDKRYRAFDDPDVAESNLVMNPVIWRHVLDLIYTGYTDIAVKLLNDTWPHDIRGKDVFWQDFRRQLQWYSHLWDARHLDQLLPRHLPPKG